MGWFICVVDAELAKNKIKELKEQFENGQKEGIKAGHLNEVCL